MRDPEPEPDVEVLVDTAGGDTTGRGMFETVMGSYGRLVEWQSSGNGSQPPHLPTADDEAKQGENQREQEQK